MANPAALLHTILRQWYTGHAALQVRRVPTRDTAEGWAQARQAVKHLDAIAQILAEQQASGKRVGAYVAILPSLTAAVFAYPNGWHAQSAESIRDTDLALLDTLAGQLDDWVPEPTTEQLDSIGPFLTKISEAVVNDTSLPEELRQHLAGLVLHVQDCLTNYSIVGAFDLRTAMDRLLMAVNYAAAESDDKSRWKAATDGFFYPFTVSVLASPVGAMLTQLMPGAG